MKELWEKLVDILKMADDDDVPSTIGITLIGDRGDIEIQVDSNLKVEFKDNFMYVESAGFIGIINTSRIEQMTEI